MGHFGKGTKVKYVVPLPFYAPPDYTRYWEKAHDEDERGHDGNQIDKWG